MRRLFKSLMDLSLFQQMSVIVVTLGVILVFFFSVYQRGNIADFVDSQVTSLLHRSQNTVAMNILDNDKVSTEFSYDQDVMHFVYVNNKCAQFYSNKIVDSDFIEMVNQIVSETEANVDDSLMYRGMKYNYYLTIRGNNIKMISLVDQNYGKAIEATLLNSVSNNSAVVFGFIFILLTLWVSTIITPLLQMQSYIEKIKNGEQNAKLNINRKDEIGELADALVSMHSQIRSQEELKEEMIHNISHDLKTPIATIKSYAESIKDGIYPYDTLEKSVDVIIDNADRLEKKVYSLLLLNRLDYVKSLGKDSDEVCDMKDVVEDVLTSLKMIRPEVKVNVDLHQADFKGERESWRIVVSNLLDNALRYAKSQIDIYLNEDEFTISNDGPSLSQDRIDKMFKPFEKGDKGKFGLGLSICYKVCNTYGYSIEAENLENGVIFRINNLNVNKKEKKKWNLNKSENH
ncbi:MAG: ATP-binding protein [Erysipelotrichaceae bacterium]